MDDNIFGWRVLKRTKAKKQSELQEPSEAKRLFFIFFPEAADYKASSLLLPFNPIANVSYLKQAALAILSTGIIGDNGLRGHARHKKFFPVDQRKLILDLIETHDRYTSITYSPEDILKRFDRSFNDIAELARLAGVTDKKISAVSNYLQRWRDKISQSTSRGDFPSNWRELMKESLISSYKYHSKSEAQALAIIFLEYAPEAKSNRIATWVNSILESLGSSSVKQSDLSKYIQKERGLRPWLSQNPSK